MVGTPFDEVERLYLAGREAAALDLAARLLPGRLPTDVFISLRHEWPNRLEHMHPAALSQERRKNWDSVAALGMRRPIPPDWKPEPPVGTVDFPVLGRGGASDRLVRVQVDVISGRKDRLPSAKQITPAARNAIASALEAARTLLPQRASFHVTLPDIGIPIDEASLGLPVAIAAISAALKWGISERLILTGCLTAQGLVGAVDGLTQKQRLVQEERPLAELLNPESVPTLSRAVAQVFRSNLAKGRSQYRMLLRREVEQEDVSRYRRVGLATENPVELRKIFVEPELLPDASDTEWRKKERELAQAVEEPGIGLAEQEVRRRAYRAWVGRDFCRGSDGATERLAWKTNYETHRALIICGELGMGKTTLLARLVLDSLGNSSAVDDKSQPAAALPVLVSAADFSSKEDHSLAAFVTRAVQKTWADAPRDVVAALVDAFHEDRIELFIDGLNELEEAERPELLQRLAAWHAMRPAMRCVLTTRPAALAAVAVPQGFRVFHLAGLSEQQGYRMMAHGKPYHGDGLWQTWHFIRSQNALREIAANPLLLMLTSRLKTSEIETLRHWVDVYERTMPLLLRGPHGAALPEFDFRLCIRAWSSVADVLQRRGQLTLREHEARQLIGRGLGRSSESRERKVEELLAVATEHGGLLTRRGRHDLSFWHPSFQEYLTAVQWSESVSESARVDSLLRDWQPLVERRNNHETLRLALGRMAFHQGDEQRRLAVELLTQIANVPLEDALIDGVWLCLAADACLDGVPVAPRVREQLAIRLSERVRRFDDVLGTERLTRLAACLLTNDVRSSQTIHSLAKLVETPERLSREALASTMQLLAMAATSDEVALSACRQMYERVRPTNEDRRFPFPGGWQKDILPIAALGLLRAGIVPDGAAVLTLGPKDSLSSSYARPDVVNALLSNALAADELRPFLHDEDAAVQAAARCLYAVARPLSPEANEWIRQCVEKRAYTNEWLRIVAERHPAGARQLFEMATASDYEAVRGVLRLLIGSRVETKLIVSLLVPWLLAQPFSRGLVDKLDLRFWHDSPHHPPSSFRQELSHQLDSIATCASSSAPETARALGWLVSLFGMPTDAARKRELRKRMGAFAAAPDSEARDWLSLLVEYEDRALAGVLAARLIRDVDSDRLKPIIRIIHMMDLRKWWPRRVYAAVNARALRAAEAGCFDDVLTCAVLTDDHNLDGVTRALEMVAEADSGLPSWDAGVRLLRLRRMSRELAISMLRQIDRVNKDRLSDDGYFLSNWIRENCSDDEGVIRAMLTASSSAASDYLRSHLNDNLRLIVTSCPERVNLLIEHLRSAQDDERVCVRRLLSSACGRENESATAIQQIVSRWSDDPEIRQDIVWALGWAGAPLDGKQRSIIQQMARRTDDLGQWADAWLSANIEDLPAHWESVERRLLSENLAEVLSAAGDLLRDERRPAMLISALRRCLSGSPLHALRAALILYGIEEPISDAVPKLLECLCIHDQTHIYETDWVIKRRRPHVIHVGADIVISRVQESEEQDDEDKQDATGDAPPPGGRERFRPEFWYQETVAQCAASLLAEIQYRDAIPRLIEWLRGPDDRSRFARNLLRFLDAESEPGFRDWLIEQVEHGHHEQHIHASNALLETGVAPRQHISALLARLSRQRQVYNELYRVGSRILILCATREECACTAEATLDSLDPPIRWLVARWLIGVGRSSPAIAAAYVDWEIKLPDHQRFDELTFGLRSREQQDWHSLFDEGRLVSDEQVLSEFALKLGEGTSTGRCQVASVVIARMGVTRHILDEHPRSISLTGPLREPLIAALRSGLACDDIAVRSDAVDSLDRLGCFDDSIAAAAVSCLQEEFGDGPTRLHWGDRLSEPSWEKAALSCRLEAARVLIGRGQKTEPIRVLSRLILQPETEYSIYFLIDELKLFLECGADQSLVRQVLVRHLKRGWIQTHHFRELLPLLQRVEVANPLARATVLEQFARNDDFSIYLIRQWANRDVVYSDHDVPEWINDMPRRDRVVNIPVNGTALDVRTAQLKWLSARNFPHERIQSAMVLLAVRYDEERATRLTQAIIDRRTDTTARELVERDLASDESDGQGQQLSKAWLLAALTDAAQGV